MMPAVKRALLISWFVGAGALAAHAEVPQAGGPRSGLARTRLEVTRGRDAQGCPDVATLEAQVEARLGRGLFARDGDEGEARRIVVSFARRGAGFAAELRLSEAGIARGTRRLASRGRCAEITESVALAIALAIDPLGELASDPDRRDPVHGAAPVRARRPPEEEAHMALVRAPPALDDASRSPRGTPGRGEELASARATPRLGVAAVLGLSPSEPALGPSLGLGVAFGSWVLGLDAVLRLGNTRLAIDGERLTIATRSVGVEGSVGWRQPQGLGLTLAFAAEAWGISGPGGDGVRAHLAASLGLTWRLSRAELIALLTTPLGRQRLDVDGLTVWRMPALLLGLGLRVDLDGSAPEPPIPLR